jgi:PTS system nitrogen regulatory IIA component
VKLSAREAARLLSVSESELYHWIEDGEIPFYMVNHQPLFNREELLEWATEHKLRLSVELFADGAQPVLLGDALARGGIHHAVAGEDRASALRAAVAKLPIADEGERELVLEIILARESEASTGVGDGIAIPHVRSPLVFAGEPPAIALCFLAQPIEFDAIDHQPVTTLFVMMTPTVQIHLQLLSRLSVALHDPAFVAVLARRAEAAAVLAEAQRIEGALEQR